MGVCNSVNYNLLRLIRCVCRGGGEGGADGAARYLKFKPSNKGLERHIIVSGADIMTIIEVMYIKALTANAIHIRRNS